MKKSVAGAVLIVLMIISIIIILKPASEDSRTAGNAEMALVSEPADVRTAEHDAPSADFTAMKDHADVERVAPTTRDEHGQQAFSGTVLDADSKSPIPGARISAYLFRNGVFALAPDYPEMLSETTAAADGTFEFPVTTAAADETIAWRVEFAGRQSQIKLFPAGDGITNRALTTFLLPPADVIQGIVTDQNEQPIAGAQVGEIVLEDTVGGWLAAGPGTYTSSWTRTAGDGRFALSGIPLPDRDPIRKRDARLFRIPASADGYQSALSEPVKAGDNSVKIVLQKSEASIAGRVLDYAGDSVHGAAVVLLSTEDKRTGHPATRLSATTEADGRFAFPNLTAGNYMLTARKEAPESLGFSPQVDEQVALLRDQQRNVTLQFPPPVVVSGTFHDADSGDGVPGVVIFSQVEEATARAAAPRVVSDEQGRFSLRLHLPKVASERGFSPRLPIALPSPWQVPEDAMHEQYMLQPDALILRNLHPGRDVELQIPLARGTEVAGIVIEPDGTTPAAGIPLFYHGGRAYGDTLTGTDGRFLFIAPPGSDLTIEASSERGIAAQRLQVPSAERAEDVRLQLEAYGTVSGTVTGSEGVALAGFELEIHRIGAPGEPKSAIRFEERGVTDAEGKYRIERVAPGNLQVALLLPPATSYVDPGTQSAQLAPAEELEGVDFELSEGDYIAGHVVDNEGQPLADVTLVTDQVRFSATTDEQGAFRIEGVPLDTALGHITALKPGYQEETKRNVSIYDRDLRFVLSPTGSVVVSVLDQDGERTTNYRARLLGEGNGPANNSAAILKEAVVLDPEGLWKLDQIGAGNYRVEVEKLGPDGNSTFTSGASDFTMTSTGTEPREVVVQLSDGIMISGAVITGDGAPVAGATVELVNVPAGLELPGAALSGPPYRRTAAFTADAQGLFAIGPLPPARYQIRAERDALVSELQSVDAGAGQNQSLEITVSPSPLVRGKVLGKDGEPVRMATVFFARGEDPPQGEPLKAPGGIFEKRLPGSGDWRVIASEDNTRNSGMTRVSLQPGEEREVTIDFSGRVALSGRILVNGAPTSGLGLLLVSANGDEAVARPESAGYSADVFPGLVTPVLAEGNMRVPVGEPFTIAASPKEQQRDIALNLTEIDLVVDSGEREFPGGDLSLWAQRNGSEIPVLRNYQMDRSGFRFFKIPEGIYQARLTRNGNVIGTSAWTPAVPGQENVLVVMLK